MHRLRLLIVDDNPIERLMLSRAAASLDRFEVIEASDGSTALRLCYERLPDIVLRDYEMPLMDGPTFISAMRKIKGAEKAVVALLTSHSSEETIIAGLGAGADEYLFKPLRVPEVQARLKALCRVADLQRGLTTALAEVNALQSLRIAEQRSRLARFLSQGLSHEMNTPLQALLSNISFIQEELQTDDPDIKEALQDCLSLVDRLNLTTQRFTDFQRVRDSAEPRLIALKPVLEETLRYTPKVACRIDCNMAEQVEVDPIHLRVALGAILTAMSERGGEDMMISLHDKAVMISARYRELPDEQTMNALLDGAFDNRHMSRSKAEFGLTMAQDTLRQSHANLRFSAIAGDTFCATVTFRQTN